MATREQIYKQQLTALGVYDAAFDPEIHQLAILERELQRTMKAWKATAKQGEAPSPTNDLYAVIQSQRREILQHRDALGLTPRALQRLRGKGGGTMPLNVDSPINRMLDMLAEKVGSYD